MLLDLSSPAGDPSESPKFLTSSVRRSTTQAKLDILVGLEYLVLVDKRVGDVVPANYMVFRFAASIGVLAHLAAVNLLLLLPGFRLQRTQFTFSVIVIGINFQLNNQLTFRSARLRARRFAIGMACSIPPAQSALFLNLHVMDYLTALVPWYVAATAASPSAPCGTTG